VPVSVNECFAEFLPTIDYVGFAGINLGRLDYFFHRGKGTKQMVSAVCPVSPFA